MKLAGSFDGYAFGPGGVIGCSHLEGLDDLPARRQTNQDRPSGGQQRGVDIRGERTIKAQFVLTAFTPAAYETLRLGFLAAFSPTPDEVELLFDDSTRLVWASVDSRVVPVQTDATQRTAEADVVLVATDPVIYGAEPEAATVGASSSLVTYGGAWQTRAWLLEVDGPLTDPEFTAEGPDGSAFTVTRPGLTVLSTERLEVDGRHGEMRVLDTVTGERRLVDPVDPGGRPAVVWPLQAGSAHVALVVGSGTATGTLTVHPGLGL